LAIFSRSTDGVLHQGEILSNVIQVHVRVETIADGDDLELEERTHPFAVVLTQECDLDWDFKARNSEEDPHLKELKLVPNVLFCEVLPAQTIRPRIRGSDIWRRITGNQDERYHYLAPIPMADDLLGEGTPALIADFKRIFTLPTDELYRRLEFEIRRRGVPANPYLQHFSSRFAYYCLRVALPAVEVDVPALRLPEVAPLAE
jgi:hypothetical protein